MFKFISFLLLAVFISYADDLTDAKIALSQGNYKVAMETFNTLANNGNVDAQVMLAIIYEQGQGVTQDYQGAFKSD